MEIIIIAAMAQNRVIGVNNKMPWHIPEELKLFKKTTIGYPMIMGRKTFESFPTPLPGRRHIVLSRNKEYQPKGAEYASSLTEALDLCGDVEKVFIIGGAEIFLHGFDVATHIILTVINKEVEGDVSFPHFTSDEFIEERREHFPEASESFTVFHYRRK
ncbi:dihydrofolate reductase [Desulforhopalus sp. IMCC35007]|uniref:dihydrofolate reductase n=1 Tax=Desulforhopalus sp. IMCC35007 TaxID=2569543 RepID=UPI0010AE383B|nr:dihydrofolate reductase [Desulforhopalus sp. IMCC35007]TKB09986.1 dihydrofolate reductase [Desulforhopalus sp. IMCC35007]